MFGIGSIELLVLAIAAILFVGPQQMKPMMRTIGRFIGKVRAYSRHFTAGIDNIVREAELEEMEKQWKAQNEAIMAEFPSDMTQNVMLPEEKTPPEEPGPPPRDAPGKTKDDDLP